MAELNFYWRLGDYALEATPECIIASDGQEEQNITINLVKYYQYQGHECKYSIGYFYYDEIELCWELKFVGGRFKELLETDVVAVFRMLKAAYDVLEEWVTVEKSYE